MLHVRSWVALWLLFIAQQDPWNATRTNRNSPETDGVAFALTTMKESSEATGASAEEDLDSDLASDEDDEELFSEPSFLHLPNPWIDNPNPQSKSYPGIGRRLRKFQNRRRWMHRRGETWPYRLYADEPSHILFFEFRGYGPPPDDVGNTGDIYIDLTPYPRLLLYVCHGEKDWKCANWSSNPNVVEFGIHVHPLLKGRYLWGTASSGFMWFTPASIRYEDLYRHTDTVNYDGMIAKAMRWDFGDDLRGPDNMRRREAEESRRKALQDEWLEQHKGWTMSPEEVRKEGERKKEQERYAEESRIWREKKLLRDRDRPSRHNGLIEGQPPVSPVDGHLEAHSEPVPIEDLSHLPKPAGRTGPRKRHSRSSLSPIRGDSIEGEFTHTRQPSIKKPRLEAFSSESQQGSPGSLLSVRLKSERTNSTPLVQTPPVRGTQHTGNVTHHTSGLPTHQALPRPSPALAPSLKRKRHSSHGPSEDGFRGDDEGASEPSLPKKKSIKGVLSTLKFKKLAKPQENVVPKPTILPRLSHGVTTPTLAPSPVPLRHAPVPPSQLSSSLNSNLPPISSSMETQKRKRTNAHDDESSFRGGKHGASELLLPLKKPKQGVGSKFTGLAKPQTGFSGVAKPTKPPSLPKKQPKPPSPPRSGRAVEEPSVDNPQVDERMLVKSNDGEGGAPGLRRPAITEGKLGRGSLGGRETQNTGLTDEGGTWDENESFLRQSDKGESETEQIPHDIVGAPASIDCDDQEGENAGLDIGCETPCSPEGHCDEETEAENAVHDVANRDAGGSHADADRETPGMTGGCWMSNETDSSLEGSRKEECETGGVIQDNGNDDEEYADEIYEGPDIGNGGPDAEGAWDETRSLSQGSHEEENDELHDSVNENGGILADPESSGRSWASDRIQLLLETSHEGEIETGDLVNEDLEENRQAIHDSRGKGEKVRSEFAGGDDLPSQNRGLSEETISKEDELVPEDPDLQSEQAAPPSLEFQGFTFVSRSQQDPGRITDVGAIREIIQKAADGTTANYILRFLVSYPYHLLQFTDSFLGCRISRQAAKPGKNAPTNVKLLPISLGPRIDLVYSIP